jgi:hypothetical protein
MEMREQKTKQEKAAATTIELKKKKEFQSIQPTPPPLSKSHKTHNTKSNSNPTESKLEKNKRLMKEIMKECTFRPQISGKIPNFTKAQESFQKVLEGHKSQKGPTIPIPFAVASKLGSKNNKNEMNSESIGSKPVRKEIPSSTYEATVNDSINIVRFNPKQQKHFN